MSVKKKSLGRGLDALLGGVQVPGTGVEDGRTEVCAPAVSEVTRLPIDLIGHGRYQPRQEFDPDSLRELADSIVAQGVIQPIVVRPVGAGPQLALAF